jgi:hypothetical protein
VPTAKWAVVAVKAAAAVVANNRRKNIPIETHQELVIEQ